MTEKGMADKTNADTEMEQMGNDATVDPNKPMVSGMKHFGVGKNGMQRSVVKFKTTPALFPYSICFQFPSTFITHRYVLDLVKEKIHFVPGGGITDIQFVDRNVMHGTQNLDNRWIISLTSVEARDEIMRLGLVMFNKKILLRRYDDVIQEEYKEFQDWQHIQRKMYAKLHGLPCSSDSDDDKDKDKEDDSDDDTKKKGKKKKKRKAKNKEDDKKEKAKKDED